MKRAIISDKVSLIYTLKNYFVTHATVFFSYLDVWLIENKWSAKLHEMPIDVAHERSGKKNIFKNDRW
jgi:hypothetical protein